jgi:alpha-beta hydrolase superfamily lysophospholipase
MSESNFKGVGGLNIFFRSWRPASGTARGVVAIVPGFNSHSGYYEWVAAQLCSRWTGSIRDRSSRSR